ncbi:MAG TPA: oxidoreductase [Pseudonocardia sp.]|nr:oxidoreductase [Pseudonocardia sp.]
MRWTLETMPRQAGRTVLVTGATSGLGLAASVALARVGARVLLTARDPERGRAALDRVREQGGGAGADAELVQLDLADLASVHRAADDVRSRTGDALHVLMNNAGVMGTPRGVTADGFETQIGTNHLGHAALTWLLMPALRHAGAARVVTLSSLAHRAGGLDVDDLDFTRRRYRPDRAYSASKLANLLFAAELDRRLRIAGDDVMSVAAHPGLTATELLPNSMRLRSGSLVGAATLFNALTSQPVRIGVLPQLYAATAEQVRGGDYIGPASFGETRGLPAPARRTAAALDVELATRLWDVTAAATGVRPDPA